MADEDPKKRGPKGGIKHQPGKGHDRKSSAGKKKRFVKKAAKKRQQQNEDAKRAWIEWDQMPEDVKNFFTPPAIPRPKDE